MERAADLEAPCTELGGVDRERKPDVGQIEEVAHVASEIVVPGDGPGGRLAALWHTAACAGETDSRVGAHVVGNEVTRFGIDGRGFIFKSTT